MHHACKHSLGILPMQLSDPWAFLHFQNLSDWWYLPFLFSLFLWGSPFPGTLHFDTNFSFKKTNPKFSQGEYFICWSTTAASYLVVLPHLSLLMYQSLFGQGVTKIHKQLIVVADVSSRLLPESSKPLWDVLSQEMTQNSVYVEPPFLQGSNPPNGRHC